MIIVVDSLGSHARQPELKPKQTAGAYTLKYTKAVLYPVIID